MMNSKRIVTIICCLIGWQSSSGQAPPDNQELDSFKRWQAHWNTRFDSTIKPKVGVYPKKPADALYTFKIGGTYRFFSTYTRHKDALILNEVNNDTALQKSVFVGDDSQLPNLTLNFSGRPSAKTAWGFDLYAFQFLDGKINQTYGQGQVSQTNLPTIYSPLTGTRFGTNLGLLLGINLYGNFDTDIGTFGVKTGGIHWVSLSDFTLAGFTGYNRFMLFERNPWDPVTGNVSDRYSSFYNQGNINQDTRWGERAFTGTIVEASNLPGNLSLKALYGKTELNGGFLTIPNLSYGGQLKKETPFGFVAFNTFHNQTYSDSLGTNSIGFDISTIQFQANVSKGIILKSEIGAGQYYSPVHSLPFGEAINLKLNFTEKISKVPLELHFFRVSPNVINNNAIFFNSAIREASNNTLAAGTVGSSQVLAPFASALTAIGQFTNNRQGVNINAEFPMKKLKLSVANGISSELKGLSNQISYGHPVNQLTRSRFWRWNFPTNVGAYGRYNVIFRDVYEIVELSDTFVAKKFNVMEVQAKYSGKIGLKRFYAFLLNRYSSVQDFISPITVFSEDAYLRHYSNELETYYEYSDRCVIATYLGYESIVANYQTDLDAITNAPRNQRGWGAGLGIDYDLSKNTALFLRHRWFHYEDRNFERDAFNGTETVVELKLTF
jgi:hypothetical protein